jgi:hypothetical protein
MNLSGESRDRQEPENINRVRAFAYVHAGQVCVGTAATAAHALCVFKSHLTLRYTRSRELEPWTREY